MLTEKNYSICVVGLGYVGLPLAVEFSKHFKVIGYDLNNDRIAELNDFSDVTLEVTSEALNHALDSRDLIFTSDESKIKESNVYIITVPTPIDKHNQPDLTPLEQASRCIGKKLKVNDIVIYESTVYPGATEEVCVPILEYESGLRFNYDFFVGYSPERINPGDKTNTLTKIMKVTSGSDRSTANIVDGLYSKIVEAGTFKATSIKVAEASKIIENTQRDVNIALMNEFCQIFDKIGISTTEVIAAASTKWNFVNVTPGLVGGHCIGVDPYYLVHKAQSVGFIPDMIRSAREINDSMPHYVAQSIINRLVLEKLVIPELNILILGFTFKPNCPDIRNTKVFNLFLELRKFCPNIDILDPHVDEYQVEREFGIKVTNEPRSQQYDIIVKCVKHTEFETLNNYSLLNQSGLVIDLFQ